MEQEPIIEISGLSKVYDNDFQALNNIDLTIHKGEIFALLGPNGAGKTTLISIICGIHTPTTGEVFVEGKSIIEDFRYTRSRIGLVPQELTTNAFESVWDTVSFSRGLFGKSPSPAHIESILKSLSLWDKRNNRLMTLSGGMKRRVLIAKALSHQPAILFLDEPTAGVDVELRKDMWNQVAELRKAGTTIILTTHYIEEAEQMADRIGVINNGKIIVVEEKKKLISQLGTKEIIVELAAPLTTLPDSLSEFFFEHHDSTHLTFRYDSQQEGLGIHRLFANLMKENIQIKDIHTKETSLEDIFVGLVHK